MTEIIAHRRNTIELLLDTPREQGVEVDIRSAGDDLIIHHDPFADGERFDRWLGHYDHGTLILNVKEEGLEDRLLALMAHAGIERFFFLDQSFPFLIRTARRGERRCAIRCSEFESAQTALALASLVDWVWLDLFTDALPDADAVRALSAAGLKLCLVSPELQGRSAPEEIVRLRDHFAANGLVLDAVCTKQAAAWR